MIGAITEVWTEVLAVLTTMLASVQNIFYTAGTGDEAGELTFLGILAVITVAISICFLVISVVENFLKFRG